MEERWSRSCRARNVAGSARYCDRADEHQSCHEVCARSQRHLHEEYEGHAKRRPSDAPNDAKPVLYIAPLNANNTMLCGRIRKLLVCSTLMTFSKGQWENRVRVRDAGRTLNVVEKSECNLKARFVLDIVLSSSFELASRRTFRRR